MKGLTTGAFSRASPWHYPRGKLSVKELDSFTGDKGSLFELQGVGSVKYMSFVLGKILFKPDVTKELPPPPQCQFTGMPHTTFGLCGVGN